MQVIDGSTREEEEEEEGSGERPRGCPSGELDLFDPQNHKLIVEIGDPLSLSGKQSPDDDDDEDRWSM